MEENKTTTESAPEQSVESTGATYNSSEFSDEIQQMHETPEINSSSADYDIFNGIAEQLSKTQSEQPQTQPQAQPQAQPQLQQQQPRTKERDYSMFSEEERKILRSISNEAYEYLKNIIPEYRNKIKEYETKLQQQQPQQQQQQPLTYYEHPDAFVLTDEYKQTAAIAEAYDFEENHWEKQLHSLRAGADKLVDLIGYDEKGNPKYAEVAITPENSSRIEVLLLKNIQSAAAAKREMYNKMNAIRENFKKTYQDSINSLKALENKYLSMYDMEKSHRAKEMKNFINSLPQTFRNNPLTPVMAKMYGMILDLIEQNKKSTPVKNPMPTERELRPSGSVNNVIFDPKEYSEEIE